MFDSRNETQNPMALRSSPLVVATHETSSTLRFFHTPQIHAFGTVRIENAHSTLSV